MVPIMISLIRVAADKEATEPRVKLKSQLQMFYGHHDLVNHYGISVTMTTVFGICSVYRNHNPILSSFMTSRLVCNKSHGVGSN